MGEAIRRRLGAGLIAWRRQEQPALTATRFCSSFLWQVGDAIQFACAATDAQDGPPHCRPPRSRAPDHEYPSHLELRLTARDSGGLTDTESVQLDPRTVTLTLSSSTAGSLWP